jgi:hypothetical protein
MEIFQVGEQTQELSVYFNFLVKWVPGQCPEQRESGKTVLYLPIINIVLISYIIYIII